MENTGDALTGVIGIILFVLAGTLAVMWIIFPFMVNSQLSKIVRHARETAERCAQTNTELQALRGTVEAIRQERRMQ
jgi:hypothetical protein